MPNRKYFDQIRHLEDLLDLLKDRSDSTISKNESQQKKLEIFERRIAAHKRRFDGNTKTEDKEHWSVITQYSDFSDLIKNTMKECEQLKHSLPREEKMRVTNLCYFVKQQQSKLTLRIEQWILGNITDATMEDEISAVQDIVNNVLAQIDLMTR